MLRLALILGIITALSGASYALIQHGRTLEAAEWQKLTLQAVEAVRIEEKQKQERVNAIIQKQYDEQTNINAALNADLDRLRKRPSRTEMPRDPKTSCAGAAPSELAREYAGFLARQNSYAAEQQAELNFWRDAYNSLLAE